MNIEKYIQKIKENKLKITPKRKAVVELFLKNKKYLKPTEVRDFLKKHSSSTGLPSIYRILEEFKKAGILIRVSQDNRQLYYAICDSDSPRRQHHHHFVCRRCRKVEEVDFCGFGAVTKFIEKKLKAKAETHLLQVEGLCATCR